MKLIKLILKAIHVHDWNLISTSNFYSEVYLCTKCNKLKRVK